MTLPMCSSSAAAGGEHGALLDPLACLASGGIRGESVALVVHLGRLRSAGSPGVFGTMEEGEEGQEGQEEEDATNDSPGDSLIFSDEDEPCTAAIMTPPCSSARPPAQAAALSYYARGGRDAPSGCFPFVDGDSGELELWDGVQPEYEGEGDSDGAATELEEEEEGREHQEEEEEEEEAWSDFDISFAVEDEGRTGCWDADLGDLWHSMVRNLAGGDLSPGLLRAYRQVASVHNAPEELFTPSMLATLGTGFYRPGVTEETLVQLSWAMISVTAAGGERCAGLVRAGLLFILLSVAADDIRFSTQVRCNIFWALGNIAGESAELRDAVLESSTAVNALIDACTQHFTLNRGADDAPARKVGPSTQSSGLTQQRGKGSIDASVWSPGSLETITWVLQNLCAPRDGRAAAVHIAERFLEPLMCCLGAARTITSEALLNALWAVSYLCNSEDAHIDAVLGAGMVPVLAEIALANMDSPTSTALFPALHALAGIISGTDTQAQAVIEAGFLPCLLHLARYHQDRCVRKEACWALANLAAGNEVQVDLFLRCEAHRVLINVLEHDPHSKAREEAARGLTNLMRAHFFSSLPNDTNQGQDRLPRQQLSLIASEISLAFVRCLAKDNGGQ